MRLSRGTPDSIYDRVDDVPNPKQVERRESEASFRPERGHDQLLTADAVHGVAEVRVLPGVDGGPVKLLNIRQYVAQFRNRWLARAGLDVYRREHDRHVIQACDPGQADDVLNQKLLIHRVDREHL